MKGITWLSQSNASQNKPAFSSISSFASPTGGRLLRHMRALFESHLLGPLLASKPNHISLELGIMASIAEFMQLTSILHRTHPLPPPPSLSPLTRCAGCTDEQARSRPLHHTEHSTEQPPHPPSSFSPNVAPTPPSHQARRMLEHHAGDVKYPHLRARTTPFHTHPPPPSPPSLSLPLSSQCRG